MNKTEGHLTKRLLVVLVAGVALFSAARAEGANPTRMNLGVNFTGAPQNLALAASSGVGLARIEVIQGSDTDAVVALAARARLQLYPMLGIAQSQGVAIDARTMADFVSAFAQRYGPGGAFWAAHPELPYLPVMSYEVGNEPDITPTQPADQTHLHYANPADYATVYETSRTALHAVDPSGRAVVGGMLDSGSITLGDAERYLAAIGPMDAVGFHPYLYNLGQMEQDTTLLRQWLNATGRKAVPLDLNEFGAPTSIANWGAIVATYSRWALCTPSLVVNNVQPFWWGGIPLADTDPWASMTTSGGVATPFGSAYLSAARALVAKGCGPVRHRRRRRHRRR